MYKIEKDNSDFMVFLKTELNKLEKDYGADYTDAIFNIIIELVYKHNIKSINYTDILNKQGDVAFEALLQSIIKTDEATNGLNNNLIQIIASLDSTAEELYLAYTTLDTLRDTLKFLKLETEAISFASITGAGSLDALSSGISAYIENFLTDEEQLSYNTALLEKEFSRLNIAMPVSKDAFTT